MINLVKKENINLGILETDFDIFTDVVNTFSNDLLKKDCMVDIDDYILPNYFKNKITIALQTNDNLIGYTIFEFKNNNSINNAEIDKLFVFDQYQNKGMEGLLIESVIYVAGEVGARCVNVKINNQNSKLLNIYNALGFYETSMMDNVNILSCNVSSIIKTRMLNDKFRDIPSDYVDYKTLKLVKKIASGRSGNIYLTEDGKILKMFKSTSFTYIKDREETLRYIKSLDLDEIIKPKNLVYYDGVFVGYIMEYLPEGQGLWDKIGEYSFEDKIEKIKLIEDVMKKLHKKNIYVCDLNPDNIFFDKEGNVKLIDCDAFVIKKNILNNQVDKVYQDPIYKVVSEKTDLYAFSVTSLQMLINNKIDKDKSFNDVVRIYEKNKNKMPISFKNYYDSVFKTRSRHYLSDFYENYLNEMYSAPITEFNEEKSGNISIIILSFILLVIAFVGYFVFKYSR